MAAKTIYSVELTAFLKVMARVKTDASITQHDLAQKMEISQSTLSDILRGQRRLDVIEWLTFCKACNIKPRQFLDELDFLLSRE